MIDLLLREKKDTQDKLRTDNAPFYHDEGFIFSTNKSYPNTIKHISVRMVRFSKRTSIQIHLIQLGNTHTSLSQTEIILPEIMEQLGHEDENTTKKIYLHITKDMKKEASTKFSHLMKDLSNQISVKT